MLPIISWRNIWRHRIRSLVVMVAIILGLWSGIFLMAFSWGLSEQRARSVIETQVSHLQLHNKEFKDEQKVQYTIPEGMQLLDSIRRLPEVQFATGRVVVNGMAASAKGGSGVQIQGVSPAEEAALTRLDQRIVDGAYFEGISRNPILIGGKLADKLKLKLRSKIVLTFQDAEGEITAGAFRIAGIYQSINSKYDETHVFVRIQDIQRLLGQDSHIHEIALLLHDENDLPALKAPLQNQYSSLMIEDWQDLAPDLKMVAETFDVYMDIFMGIIMLALAFGIINTMLMAVLERTRELGMLMSIGMTKGRVFAMIMLETLFLALAGTPVGLLFAWLSILYFGQQGIDMSVFAEGLSSFGYDSIVYPNIEGMYYQRVAIMVVITALLSSIYPAYKALKLKPVEAVRAI